MSSIIPWLVFAGATSGLPIARLKHIAMRRIIGWLFLIILTTTAHFVMIEETPLIRMIGLCCILFAAMKGLIYAEWANSRKLNFKQYFIFAFLWFGMDPESFAVRRNGLNWRHDLAIGLILMLIGTLGAWIVWNMEWRHIFIMFLPMSIGFHFGALRVLKGILRYAGFPVRTLFPNPLKTHGIGDFWSRRWNVGYSQMLQRLVGRPIDSMIGPRAAIMAVFITSGLLHEIAITLPCRSGYGLPTLYFIVHGILTLIEKTLNRPLGKIPTLLAVILPMPWLFPPTFQTEVIEKCLGLFF